MPKARKRRAGRQFQLRKLKAQYYKGCLEGSRPGVFDPRVFDRAASETNFNKPASHKSEPSANNKRQSAEPRIVSEEPFPYKVYLIKGAPEELVREIRQPILWGPSATGQDSITYTPSGIVDHNAKTPPRAFSPDVITLD